jgi:hypothetical protein
VEVEMNDDDKFWQLYGLIKQAKPDLSHEEIVALVEKKLEKEN